MAKAIFPVKMATAPCLASGEPLSPATYNGQQNYLTSLYCHPFVLHKIGTWPYQNGC